MNLLRQASGALLFSSRRKSFIIWCRIVTRWAQRFHLVNLLHFFKANILSMLNLCCAIGLEAWFQLNLFKIIHSFPSFLCLFKSGMKLLLLCYYHSDFVLYCKKNVQVRWPQFNGKMWKSIMLLFSSDFIFVCSCVCLYGSIEIFNSFFLLIK